MLQDQSNILKEVFQRLYLNDKDVLMTVQNALFDWVNDLTYCAGAVKLVLKIENDLDEHATTLLQGMETELDKTIVNMRTALIDASKTHSPPSSE